MYGNLLQIHNKIMSLPIRHLLDTTTGEMEFWIVCFYCREFVWGLQINLS